MGFPRKESWNVLPYPSPGDLPDPGIKPGSPALQADSYPRATREALMCSYMYTKSNSLSQFIVSGVLSYEMNHEFG